MHSYADEHTDGILTNGALECVRRYHPDFVFLCMVETDEKCGHDCGWMTPTYLQYVHDAINNAKKLLETVGDEYSIIVTADHGAHGTARPKDMTIPMFFLSEPFQPGKKLDNVSILDLAPTIAKMMQSPIPREWEGKSLI